MPNTVLPAQCHSAHSDQFAEWTIGIGVESAIYLRIDRVNEVDQQPQILKNAKRRY